MAEHRRNVSAPAAFAGLVVIAVGIGTRRRVRALFWRALARRGYVRIGKVEVAIERFRARVTAAAFGEGFADGLRTPFVEPHRTAYDTYRVIAREIETFRADLVAIGLSDAHARDLCRRMRAEFATRHPTGAGELPAKDLD